MIIDFVVPFVLCFMAQDVGFLGISHGILLGKARVMFRSEEGGWCGPSKLEESYEPGTPNNHFCGCWTPSNGLAEIGQDHFWDQICMIPTWYSKEPFFIGCFSWMTRNHYIKKWFEITKHRKKKWLFRVPEIYQAWHDMKHKPTKQQGQNPSKYVPTCFSSFRFCANIGIHPPKIHIEPEIMMVWFRWFSFSRGPVFSGSSP